MKLPVIDILKVPPGVHVLVAAVSATAALLATQSLISNNTEKLVTGLGSIWLPLGYLGIVGLIHLKEARVHAARIMAGQPTQTLPS